MLKIILLSVFTSQVYSAQNIVCCVLILLLLALRVTA